MGVAKHFVHGALLKRVDTLTCQLVSICRVHRTTPLCLNQDVGEEEKHLGFGLRAFRGHRFQPTFTDIPATWQIEERRKSARQDRVLRLINILYWLINLHPTYKHPTCALDGVYKAIKGKIPDAAIVESALCSDWLAGVWWLLNWMLTFCKIRLNFTLTTVSLFALAHLEIAAAAEGSKWILWAKTKRFLWLAEGPSRGQIAFKMPRVLICDYNKDMSRETLRWCVNIRFDGSCKSVKSI